MSLRRLVLVPGGWGRFRADRRALVGLVMVALVLAVAALAPWLSPRDPYLQDLTATQASPSPAHWFGTDQVGRDQLSRVLHGTRTAVVVGFAAAGSAVALGVALGALAGYLGGAWDTLVMRLTDVFLAFPVIIGALLLAVLLGRGSRPLVVAIALFGWATVARLLRGTMLPLKEVEFIQATRAMGATGTRTVFRHLLPNSLAPVLVYGALAVPGAISVQAALSYLGIGLEPGRPDWGQMIADGQGFFGYKDFLWLFPSLALTFTTLAFVLVADGLRDALDPEGALMAGGLEVEDLTVEIAEPDGPLVALDGVSWSVAPGEMLGLVGESGSGKTMCGLAVLGSCLPQHAFVGVACCWLGRTCWRGLLVSDGCCVAVGSPWCSRTRSPP